MILSALQTFLADAEYQRRLKRLPLSSPARSV